MSFVTCCVLVPSLAQAKCSLCMSGVGWDWGRSSAGAEPFVCFLLTSTILKPLTMPNIPISEVDALPENDQTSSPTGTCMVGGSSSLGPTVWRLMWWMLFTVTYVLKTKFTRFNIQNLLKKKNWKFPISSTHWVSLPRSKLKAFFPRYSLQSQGNTHQQSLMVGCHFFSSHFNVSGCILHIPFLLVCLEDCSIQTHGELLHSLQLCCITLYEKNNNLIAPYW